MEWPTDGQKGGRADRPLRKPLVDRAFLFTLAGFSLIAAKAIHFWALFDQLPRDMVMKWAWSFFTQDYAVLLLLGWLAHQRRRQGSNSKQRILGGLSTFLHVYVLLVCIANVSFYLVSAGEIHWRGITEVSDASSQAILMTGMPTFLTVAGILVVLAAIGKGAAFAGIWFVIDSIAKTFNATQAYATSLRFHSRRGAYTIIADEPDPEIGYHIGQTRPKPNSLSKILLKYGQLLARFIVVTWLLINVVVEFIRPSERSVKLVCYTPPVLPLVDFGSTDMYLADLPQKYASSIGKTWDNVTTLQTAPKLDWLPNDILVDGFDYWNNSKPTYNAAADPLLVSNLDQAILPELREALKKIDIKHVLVFMLESTRKDVFPFKKDSNFYRHLENSFAHGELPESAKELLANLTPAANYITGDYDDGFEHASKPKRGGISFTNAHSASSFTLKSIMGTSCGMTPLTGDFDMEAKYPYYQPCLPHILRAMNDVEKNENSSKAKAKSGSWRTSFMQSVTLNYLAFRKMMEKCGFDSLIDREYLVSRDAKFGQVTIPDVYYFGFQETPLEPYIREQFANAKETGDRVFLTHITGTTHHPFKLPDGEEYVQVARGSAINDYISGYINTIGYVDRWVSTVLKVLDEEGVANDTLVIFQGDHGLATVETGQVATYYNPHERTFHVPLVLSNPLLPAMEVSDPVSAVQVLPTVLDILIESGSLSGSSLKVAKDMIQLYEGQSLIRKQVTESKTGQGYWQFGIVFPGSPMVFARDARHPDRRLVVPIQDNQSWRLTDPVNDELEKDAIVSIDYASFLRAVEEKHGIEMAQWVEEGAFVVRWWTEDQRKRWRYGKYAEAGMNAQRG